MHRCEEISNWVLQKFRFVIGVDSPGSGDLLTFIPSGSTETAKTD